MAPPSLAISFFASASEAALPSTTPTLGPGLLASISLPAAFRRVADHEMKAKDQPPTAASKRTPMPTQRPAINGLFDFWSREPFFGRDTTSTSSYSSSSS